ncbi:related to transcriptional activator acu-15 [Phialocephala subalpina]|uniref:Related to transcriptional activator acu-15 n=1 Tax=Phialocephala subalpina TaxID=576137 RepID=A0A1L7XXI2_9HELO|nr:related to transcriptional activator acu-15 [Phialocephala subalpina]
MPDEFLRRRRVAMACLNCRAQKAKCDGKRPICSRCEGYGHSCIWSGGRKTRSQTSIVSSPGGLRPESLPPEKDPWQMAVRSYDTLVRRIRPDLSESARAATDSSLSYIRNQLPQELSELDDPLEDCPPSTFQGSGRIENPQRYLGEASDVRFFHAVKQVLQDNTLEPPEVVSEHEIQSYDQGIEPPDVSGRHIGLPPKESADSYINIYFSTIHIAYPFICKPEFMVRYEKYWKGDLEDGLNASWLSILYTIFSIGAYYHSFPRSENDVTHVHLRYFRQALALSGSVLSNCTLTNVQMLLTQCFFLLATGQTDRCWNSLGLAIRVGQSIGLHVENALKSRSSPVEQETMRRTWYSMFVLDRLLALQLGRPIAIHEEDYSVNEPAPVEGSFCHDSSSQALDDDPTHLDYFRTVITFSRILGRVISALYRPSQLSDDSGGMLLSTVSLDKDLIAWRNSLPRHLRFDLGHTFDRSITFRRQRNMLSIKFHHLRTLMHRPYLSLIWLQGKNQNLMELLERDYEKVQAMENICVHEAQQTAHLLHHVGDERSLVHDFPWWQMISCLLCASSVLLVARACIDPSHPDTRMQSQALDEDAETCMKVFDALSVNSEAARRARDMMKGLKRTRILPRRTNISMTTASAISQDASRLNVPFMGEPLHGFHGTMNYVMGQDDWQTWPGELSDPVAWSAQFIHPTQLLSSGPMSESEIAIFTQINGNG